MSFSSVEQDAWGGLLSTYARLNRLIEADLLEHGGITHAEFEVLLRLAWQTDHKLRIQDLVAQSLLTQSGTSRLVDRLVKAGLVTREGASEDRRGAYAVLTPAGAERFQAVAAAHMTLVKQAFLDLYSEAELKKLGAFWKRFAAHHAAEPAESSSTPRRRPAKSAR